MSSGEFRSIEHLIPRVRSEYLEMPGLCLTDLQAGRLWGLDGDTCQRVLQALVESQFLMRTLDGRYRMRATERSRSLLMPARAADRPRRTA